MGTKQDHPYQKVILAAVITFAFIWLSNDEFNHDLKQAQQYNQDVCAGLIPDYGNIKPNCEGEQMRYHLTPISSNKKTGPIPVSTTSAETCPPACPFNDGGCYAKSGPLALHWKKVSEDQRGDDFDTFISKVKKIAKNQLFRHNQAGDLFGTGNRINSVQLQKFAIAAKRTNCFTYTHKPATKANV